MSIRYIFVLFGLLGLIGSQSAAQAAPTNRLECAFSEVYNYDGWKIPGAAGATPAGPRLGLVSSGPNAGDQPNVFATPLKASENNLFLTSYHCSHDFPGRIVFRNTRVRVLELWRFESNGRVFAYGGVFETQHSTPLGQSAVLEDVLQVLFYDQTGSGRFTTARYPKRPVLEAIEVPEWASHPVAPDRAH